MKSEVKEKESKELKFPCLMRSKMTGAIVAIESIDGKNGTGYVVHVEKSNHPMFYTSNKWPMNNFELFHGTVTLSND